MSCAVHDATRPLGDGDDERGAILADHLRGHASDCPCEFCDDDEVRALDELCTCDGHPR